MNRKYIKSLLMTAVLATGTLHAAGVASERDIHTITDTYSINKQQYESLVINYINKGNELYVAGNFKDAAANYVEARLILETLKTNSAQFTQQLESVKELIAKSYYNLAAQTAEKAHAKANSQDIESAIAYCKEAIAIYPACEKEMLKHIEEYKKMIAATLRNNRLSVGHVIPDLSEKKYQVAILLKQAKMLYYTRQYELARTRYKEVLMIDKVCPEAIQGLRATNVQLQRIAQNRYRITHKKQMAEAAWEGTAPIIKHKQVDVREEFEKGKEQTGSNQFIDDDTRVIREKLRNIVLPRVNFTGTANSPGTDLQVAVKYLRDHSKARDPEGQGVNIYLYFPEEFAEKIDDSDENTAGGNSGSNKDSDDADGEEDYDDEEEDSDEDEESSSSSSPKRSKYPVVNLDLYNKSLLEIIDSLANAANLKYKIEKHAVLLAPKDAKIDDMQIKVFMFDEGLVDALGGDPKPEALQKGLTMLPDANIQFPVGSKVMYDPRFRSLVVLNTPENLSRINDAIIEVRKLAPPPLVQVQVKFVEVEQSDLKELGFIQSLSRTEGDNGKTNGRLQFDKNDETIYNSGRNTFTYSNSWKGYNYSMIVNAVNQLDSKDVLSSPKVLTVPEKTVSIKMTSERYFEWDYEEGEFEVSSDEGMLTYSYTPPWPEFEKLELGITMEITPKVDVAKRLIMLDVHPWVSTLVGWTEYEYQVTADDENSGGVSQTETMRRPIIAERTTNTNIAVYDGETVVIGGIIKDYTVTIDDKIPILGDIPLLGNFFKSKSTTVKKTNLLIFVTARMIKPDGTPFFPAETANGRLSTGVGDLYDK